MIVTDQPPEMTVLEATIEELAEAALCRWRDSIGRRFESEVLSSAKSSATALRWDVEAAEGELRRIAASLHAARRGY